MLIPCKSNKITTAVLFITIAAINTISAQRIPIITFEKNPCLGSCPAYKLEIYRNRKMNLTGVKYLNTGEGNFTARLNKKVYKDLIAGFHHIHFFELKDSYATKQVTDLPTRYISFAEEGKSKTVMDYTGAPVQLTQLEEKLQQLVDNTRWKKSD